MIYSFAAFLFLITAGVLGLHFFSRLRSLNSASVAAAPPNLAGRYQPMLRLLSDDDLSFVAGNPALASKLRSQRRKLFRGYLACLTRDYGRLLAGVRLAMVQAQIDRPDLARALAKNRFLFAAAICRIEIRLALHATGAGTVDVSALVDALEILRSQVAAFTPVPMAAAS